MRETVTEKEKAVLDAMRMGADVNVTYVTERTIDEVDDFLQCFDGLKEDTVYVHDRTDFGMPYVGFVKYYRDLNLSVIATIKVERRPKDDENIPE